MSDLTDAELKDIEHAQLMGDPWMVSTVADYLPRLLAEVRAGKEEIARLKAVHESLYQLTTEAQGRYAAALQDKSRLAVEYHALGFRPEPSAKNFWDQLVTERNDAVAEAESLKAERKYWERGLAENERLKAENEKQAYTVSQVCGAHIGRKMERCAACERDALKARLESVANIASELALSHVFGVKKEFNALAALARGEGG